MNRQLPRTGVIREYDMRSGSVRAGYRIILFLCCLMVVVAIFPLVWVIFAGFKDLKEFVSSESLLPAAFDFSRYAQTWSQLGIAKNYLNSLLSVAGSVLCALLSILFVETLHCIDWTYAHYLKNPYLRIIVAGLIVAAATTLLGTRDYNGAGTEVIVRALQGEAEPLAFLFKILFTALTLEAGFKGGEIVPTFFIGATFGCVAAPLLGLDPSFAAALGMTGLFCGVTNCPVASILLSFELFGGDSLVLFALCCSVSYMLSGHYSLYTVQRLEQDKFHLE